MSAVRTVTNMVEFPLQRTTEVHLKLLGSFSSQKSTDLKEKQFNFNKFPDALRVNEDI